MERSSVIGGALFCMLLFIVTQPGEGIRCWDCNSKFDPRCGHGTFDNSTLDTVDCSQLNDKYKHLGGMEAKFCRKVVQYIEGQTRTIRSCGWLRDERAEQMGGCYSRTGTKEVMVTFCTCESDSCNTAARGLQQSSLVIAMLLVTVSAVTSMI